MTIEKTEGFQVLRAIVHIVIAIGAVLAFVQTAPAQDKAKIEAGADLYSMYCSPCHGDRLINSGQTFDLRRLTANDRARFQNSVLMGKNQMPPWKGALSDEQIDLIWHYIRDNANQK